MAIDSLELASIAYPPFFDKSDSGFYGSEADFEVSGKGVRQRRVLIADDDGLIADSVAEILNDNGYQATAVYSGASAIELARQYCPDVLMCDVLMPNINGVETAIAVREVCPNTRVLLFSGHAGTVDILDRAKAKGYSFELLHKPIHPDFLLKKLAF